MTILLQPEAGNIYHASRRKYYQIAIASGYTGFRFIIRNHIKQYKEM